MFRAQNDNFKRKSKLVHFLSKACFHCKCWWEFTLKSLSFAIWDCVSHFFKIVTVFWIKPESSPEIFKCILYFLTCAVTVQSLLDLRHSDKSLCCMQHGHHCGSTAKFPCLICQPLEAWCSAADKVLYAETKIMGSNEPQKCCCLWNVTPCPVRIGLFSQYWTATGW